MTSIIKADDSQAAAAIKPLATLRRTQAPHASDTVLPDPRIAQFEAKIEQIAARSALLAEEAGALRAERDRAYAEGERAGRATGSAEANSREAERLDALKKGVEAALARYADQLAATEALARLLAVESLKRLINEDQNRIDLLARMVDVQVRQIDATSVVRLEVSRADFPDDHALDALRDQIGPRIRIDRLDEAKAGHCAIVQTLGSLDIGVDQQLGRLAELLGTDGVGHEA